MEILYSVRVDGNEITQVSVDVLGKDQYAQQSCRDEVKDKLAQEYGIPRHYMRLVEVREGECIYAYINGQLQRIIK